MSQATSSILGFDKEQVVHLVDELIKAASAPAIQTITIAQDLTDVPEIRLAPKKTLRGPIGHRCALHFQRDITNYSENQEQF
jgi:hypothetical protein